jgi:hypothetical protein
MSKNKDSDRLRLKFITRDNIVIADRDISTEYYDNQIDIQNLIKWLARDKGVKVIKYQISKAEILAIVEWLR